MLASRWRYSQKEMHSLKSETAKIRHFPLCIKENIVQIQNNPRERMFSILTHWSPLSFYDVVHIYTKNNLVLADVLCCSEQIRWCQITNLHTSACWFLIFKPLSFYFLTSRLSFDNKRLIFGHTKTVKLLSTVSLLSMQVCGLAFFWRWCPLVCVLEQRKPQNLLWSGMGEVFLTHVTFSLNNQSSPRVYFSLSSGPKLDRRVKRRPVFTMNIHGKL